MKQTLYLLLFTLQLTAQSTVLKYDFDRDGKKDKFFVLQTNQGRRICYQLSTQGNKTVSSFLFTECHRTFLELKNKQVIVTNDGMRFFYYYTFVYDSQLKEFKLIRADADRFGNCVHDASGESGYNLQTGIYTAHWNHYDEAKERLIHLPAIKKRKPVKLWLLKDYGDELLWELAQVDIETQPNCLRRNYYRHLGDSHFGLYYPEQKWIFERYGKK